MGRHRYPSRFLSIQWFIKLLNEISGNTEYCSSKSSLCVTRMTIIKLDLNCRSWTPMTYLSSQWAYLWSDDYSDARSASNTSSRGKGALTSHVLSIIFDML